MTGIAGTFSIQRNDLCLQHGVSATAAPRYRPCQDTLARVSEIHRISGRLTAAAAMLVEACESEDFVLTAALVEEMTAIRGHLKALQRALWIHQELHRC